MHCGMLIGTIIPYLSCMYFGLMYQFIVDDEGQCNLFCKLQKLGCCLYQESLEFVWPVICESKSRLLEASINLFKFPKRGKGFRYISNNTAYSLYWKPGSCVHLERWVAGILAGGSCSLIPSPQSRSQTQFPNTQRPASSLPKTPPPLLSASNRALALTIPGKLSVWVPG